MLLVRRGTFETNSSSTHSITMCSKSEFDKWKNGEIYFLEEENRFVNNEERDLIIKELIIYQKLDIDYENKKVSYKDKTFDYKDYDEKEKIIKENFITDENLAEIDLESDEMEDMLSDLDWYEMPLSYSEWYDHYGDEYELYSESYTTTNKEEVIAFGYYGYN